jgi:hypothetical protein
MKGQDVLLVLKLFSDGGRSRSFAALGEELDMSASEVHAARNRAREAGLVHPLEDRVVPSALEEFMLHALKYLFPVKPGGPTRGMPTGFAAPPLVKAFRQSVKEGEVWVWPHPEGTMGGSEIRPLCRSVPQAAQRDPGLYEWLVLADVLRGAGRARERRIAVDQVKRRLADHAPG